MGLCRCEKRRVTNLFCYEHDINVCEYCLVAEHERCIVQSYVQWLQDSDYNPICILCKNLLKDEPTVRLACYDVFHWSCIDNYASNLPANTAPAGYQCPKCKECIFPPSNLVSPVVDALKARLESVTWSRVGLGQSLMQFDETNTSNEESNLENEKVVNIKNSSQSELQAIKPAATNNSTTDDESNGFVIITDKNKQQVPINSSNENKNNATSNTKLITSNKNEKKIKSPALANEFNSISHNRIFNASSTNDDASNQMYDSSLGVVLNVDNLDIDTGENKYKRRPLFEWLARWLKSRQIANRRLFRMTRQKKIMFIIIIIFISLFTLIIIFSRLGSLNTENDPALDPMNNPNIRVE